MTRLEITRKTALATGVELATVHKVIDAFLSNIRDAVASGDDVAMRGFGTFKRVFRPGRVARNIGKGQEVMIPPRHSVKFKIAKDFKTAVEKV